MLQFMLDTNICIYLLKRHPSRLLEQFNRCSGQIAISVITVGELYFGAEKSERQAENFEAVELFFSGVTILPFSKDAALHFAQIRVELKRAGTPIGPYDMLIAAHARGEGLILVTNNEREFRRVSGLQLENWV